MGEKGQEKSDIHPLVLVIVGVIVASSSYIINLTQDSNFVVFIVAGLVMLFYGLTKYLIFRRSSGKLIRQQSSGNPQISRGMTGSNTFNNNNINGLNVQNNSNPKIDQFRFCPRCGTKIHIMSNFCPRCGLRLR